MQIPYKVLTDPANTGVHWGLIPPGPSEELYRIQLRAISMVPWHWPGQGRQRVPHKPGEEGLTQAEEPGKAR